MNLFLEIHLVSHVLYWCSCCDFRRITNITETGENWGLWLSVDWYTFDTLVSCHGSLMVYVGLIQTTLPMFMAEKEPVPQRNTLMCFNETKTQFLLGTEHSVSGAVYTNVLVSRLNPSLVLAFSWDLLTMRKICNITYPLQPQIYSY